MDFQEMFLTQLFRPQLLIGSLFAPDGTMFQILAFALTFIAALSCLSLYVRRLHDLDHGSLMVLLAFIPLISFFFAVYLMFFRGTIGPNSYGPDPLADGQYQQPGPQYCGRKNSIKKDAAQAASFYFISLFTKRRYRARQSVQSAFHAHQQIPRQDHWETIISDLGQQCFHIHLMLKH